MKRAALTLALLVVLPASAAAQQPTPVSRVVTQFTANGDPEIRVEAFDTFQVRRCPPGGVACEVVPYDPLSSSSYEAGETAAGTVFEADVRDRDGVVTTIRSLPWRGRVTALSAPTLAGDAKVGGTVTAVDGTWGGGWAEPPQGKDQTRTRVVACRAPDRAYCLELPSGPLAQRWAGWYLIAVAWRVDGMSAFLAGQVPWPIPEPAYVPTLPTYAYSAPVPVCCTLPAPVADPDPAPVVELRTRAVRANGRLLLGRVDCTLRCRVGLIVSGGGRTLTRSFTLEGRAALSIPRRRGRLSVRVKVDGKLQARGHVTAR